MDQDVGLRVIICFSEHPRIFYVGAEADEWKTFRLIQKWPHRRNQKLSCKNHNIIIILSFTIQYISFKYHIFRALALYQAGTFQDVLKVALWHTVVLASGQTFDDHDGGLHFGPVHLDTGKGQPRTFYT